MIFLDRGCARKRQIVHSYASLTDAKSRHVATPEGIEPSTCRLEVGCSIQLSYGATWAGDSGRGKQDKGCFWGRAGGMVSGSRGWETAPWPDRAGGGRCDAGECGPGGADDGRAIRAG